MLEWQWISKRFLMAQKWSFVLLTCFIGIATAAICITEYGYFNIWFSRHYHPSLGYFLKYYTHFGEEWVLATLGLILVIILKNKTFAVRISAALIINSLITIALKYLVFNQNRPKLVLQDFHLIFTQGVAINEYNSFPSGHTSAAFAMALTLSFWFANPKLSIFVLLMAIGVGLSRIYLQQHFIEDIVGGAIVGLLAACLAAGLTWNTKIEPQITC